VGHPVNWFQISGPSGAPLQSFYKEVFGWKMQPGGGGVAMIAADKPDGIPGGVGASQDGKASVAVYVSVKNLEQHLGRVESAGGHAAMQPIELPEGMGRIAGFIDPAGNWIGLWQPGKASSAPKRKTTAKARAGVAAKKASRSRRGGAKATSKTKPAKKKAKKRAK